MFLILLIIWLRGEWLERRSLEKVERVNNFKTFNPTFSIPRYNASFHQNLGILTPSNDEGTGIGTERSQLLGQTSKEQIWSFEQDISGTITLDSAFMAVMIGQDKAGVLDMSKVIVMDETFLTIGGVHYYLIVAVSKEGDLLSWALTRTRSADDLNKIFQIRI